MATFTSRRYPVGGLETHGGGTPQTHEDMQRAAHVAGSQP